MLRRWIRPRREALKNYIRIHLTSPSRPILSRSSLKIFEEKLPAGDYARVHKSFLVAIDKITSIEKESIRIGAITIPLGKSYREEFLRHIREKNV
ncbi:MAG: LytTR family transcriptional regulator [Bacteroidetes bacterium]|nr:LytTR family transcriptional regulator [Bacteroidota bacterium]